MADWNEPPIRRLRFPQVQRIVPHTLGRVLQEAAAPTAPTTQNPPSPVSLFDPSVQRVVDYHIRERDGQNRMTAPDRNGRSYPVQTVNAALARWVGSIRGGMYPGELMVIGARRNAARVIRTQAEFLSIFGQPYGYTREGLPLNTSVIVNAPTPKTSPLIDLVSSMYADTALNHHKELSRLFGDFAHVELQNNWVPPSGGVVVVPAQPAAPATQVAVDPYPFWRFGPNDTQTIRFLDEVGVRDPGRGWTLRETLGPVVVVNPRLWVRTPQSRNLTLRPTLPSKAVPPEYVRVPKVRSIEDLTNVYHLNSRELVKELAPALTEAFYAKYLDPEEAKKYSPQREKVQTWLASMLRSAFRAPYSSINTGVISRLRPRFLERTHGGSWMMLPWVYSDQEIPAPDPSMFYTNPLPDWAETAYARGGVLVYYDYTVAGMDVEFLSELRHDRLYKESHINGIDVRRAFYAALLWLLHTRATHDWTLLPVDEASKRGITWLKEEAHRRALMRVTNDVRHWHLLHSSVHGERDMALTLLETEQDFKDTGETQNICLGDTCYFESVADHGHVFYAMRELKYIDGIPWFGMSRLVIEIAPSTRRNKRGELLVNPSGWRVVDIKGRRNMNRAQWRNWLPDVDRVLAKPELGCATRYAVTPDLFTEED